MSERVIEIKEFPIHKITPSCTWVIIGAPQTGKCFARDTPILMFDGTTKMVQDVYRDDIIMGDDSTPRKVSGLNRGTDKMYKVRMFKMGHKDTGNYIINRSHILCLKRICYPYIKYNIDSIRVKWLLNNKDKSKTFYISSSYGQTKNIAETFRDQLLEDVDYTVENILEISVKDYLNLPKLLGDKYKGYKTGVDFEYKYVEDPYSVGYNSTKSIPDIYKYNSRKVRLQVLAGIIDNCGYSIYNRYFILNPDLIKDTTYLCGSLGFHCQVVDVLLDIKTCYIEGNKLHEIPVLKKKKVLESSVDCVYDIDVSYIGEGEYFGFETDGNKRFVLGDFTVTHNSSLIEDLCYVHKHKYPIARVWCGTEDTQGKYGKFVKPLYITTEYKMDEHEKGVIRQRKCKAEKCRNAYGIYILDDCNTDRKIFTSKLMRGQFKNGSQWWDNLFMIGSHYVFDMPPDLRKCVSYVAIFKESSIEERKKLYQNFAVGCNFEEFCELMDQLTGDHTCMIFNKRSQSTKIEDCVFYYKARLHNKWELGCNEYKEWAAKRYNKNYTEDY